MGTVVMRQVEPGQGDCIPGMRGNPRGQHLSKAGDSILSKEKGEFAIFISFLTKIDTHRLGEPFKVLK